MEALKKRKQAGVYTKMPNGQLSCNDAVAQALGNSTSEQVIQILMTAMSLTVNPYLHCNIGQQSMNLRNKFRGCLNRNELNISVLDTQGN